LDNHNCGVGIFIDLKKAFDNVNHDILLKTSIFTAYVELSMTGFKDYLTNRRHYVSVQNIKSTALTVTCGVPQGSILGPVLLRHFPVLQIPVTHFHLQTSDIQYTYE